MGTPPTHPFVAAYRRLPPGELARRAQRAHELMAACTLCARHCGVNRLAGDKGAVCRTGAQAEVASFGPHLGEEAPLVGRHGSGTIFFSHCNLKCVFCQNWELSQGGEGRPVTARELGAMMVALQEMGCHNVNLVSPSHVVAPILAALAEAVALGLRVPLVYNTGGYDSPEALALLDGVVDIYMPDMKWSDDAHARRFSRARGYWAASRAAVREMHRQVGDLVLDPAGVAQRGLLVRHLVLPEGLAGSEAVFRFLADQISPRTWLNVMGQYRPCYRADRFPPLNRRPTGEELERAREAARAAGLTRLDHRVPRWRFR